MVNKVVMKTYIQYKYGCDDKNWTYEASSFGHQHDVNYINYIGSLHLVAGSIPIVGVSRGSWFRLLHLQTIPRGYVPSSSRFELEQFIFQPALVDFFHVWERLAGLA